mmetsp:Transcript_58212/g.101936  ORF Transcript_58212/g.101936 Transcript_58212/m.101936 type:complete len:206 (-) Transcript_58212:1115-1732(-)
MFMLHAFNPQMSSSLIALISRSDSDSSSDFTSSSFGLTASNLGAAAPLSLSRERGRLSESGPFGGPPGPPGANGKPGIPGPGGGIGGGGRGPPGPGSIPGGMPGGPGGGSIPGGMPGGGSMPGGPLKPGGIIGGMPGGGSMPDGGIGGGPGIPGGGPPPPPPGGAGGGDGSGGSAGRSAKCFLNQGSCPYSMAHIVTNWLSVSRG